MIDEKICPDYKLQALWDALYEIYEIFSQICDNHGLRYYAFAGTLLGTIRHKGFIPWDDDLDVAMPRPDYEKFIELANKELPTHLKFVYWKNTPEFNMLFGKIQDSRKGKVLQLEENLGHKLSNGVYIDIFPIDGYPKGRFYRTYLKYRDLLLLPIERFRLYKWSQLGRRGRCAWLVGAVLSIFIPWMRKQYQFMRLHENELLKTSYEDSEFVSDVGLRYNVLSQPVLKKEKWGNPVNREFGEKSIKIQEGHVEYLEKKFGDYMKLPPISQRKPSHQYSWRCPWWLGPTFTNG